MSGAVPGGTRDPLPGIELAGTDGLDERLLTSGTLDAVAVRVGPAVDGGEPVLGPSAGQVAARYGVDLAELAVRTGATGAAGDVHVVTLPRPTAALTLPGSSAAVALPWDGLPGRLVLVGVGAGTARDLRRAGADLARTTLGWRTVASTVTGRSDESAGESASDAAAFAEGYLLGAYRTWRAPGARPGTHRPSADLVLLGHDGTRVAASLAQARAGAQAVWLARDLTWTPSSTKNPAWLADQARTLAAAAGCEVEVLGPRELVAGGFGGLLAVGGGSASPPCLVRVTSRSTAPGAAHVVLVGKGITFDTGGISLKQREAMVTMKTDMAGAAVALATVLAAARTGVRHTVTAVLPLAENHVGAGSYRPGDVVTVHGGTTVEIDNTDAEGRMVLADALDWAVRELAPDALVDLATLTGAVTVALGRTHAGLYSDDEALAAALERAAETSGEGVWRMPLVEEYRPQLRSDIADTRQSAADPRTGAGSVMAALMLQRFTGDVPWAHLDIAGTARSTSSAHELPEGATGYGVRLLLALLADQTYPA